MIAVRHINFLKAMMAFLDPKVKDITGSMRKIRAYLHAAW